MKCQRLCGRNNPPKRESRLPAPDCACRSLAGFSIFSCAIASVANGPDMRAGVHFHDGGRFSVMPGTDNDIVKVIIADSAHKTSDTAMSVFGVGIFAGYGLTKAASHEQA